MDETLQAAGRIIGAEPTLSACLAWLAQGCDTRPAWKDDPRLAPYSAWPIVFKGLTHAEGRWIVTLECGWREQVTAETPEACCAYAVVFMEAARRWRELAPFQRPEVGMVMADLLHPKAKRPKPGKAAPYPMTGDEPPAVSARTDPSLFGPRAASRRWSDGRS